MLVSRIAHNEKVQYHQLTDKTLPIDDNTNSNHIEINDSEIDPLAPKGKTMKIGFDLKIFDFCLIGNILLLPQHMSVFGLHSTITNDGNQLINSVDNQRAMKQLEISNKIQTGLELKIDTLKKEIRKLI
jgi:hypothetical protein